MQYHLNKPPNISVGMTLIETLLYIALLSMLLLGFIHYLYYMNEINMHLYDDIKRAYEE